MKRMSHRWTSPPSALRRPNARLENVALIPASELASLDKWQQRAMRLPFGETLLVLPHDNPKLESMATRIQRSLHQRGRRCTITQV